MTAAQVQARRYLADMAAKGNWQRVIQDLNPENHLLDVNQWRPGDASWTTVLHEAAKQGAPLDVVSWLINRGALRSQRDAEGKTPYDVAKLEGHAPELLDLLAPPPSPLSREQIDRLDSLLAKAIDWFFESPFEGQDLRELFRYPPVGVLHEVPGQELWMQAPTFSGGLRVALRRGYLEMLAGYRNFMPDSAVEVRTWGFVITERGITKVYEGFANTPGDSAPSETTVPERTTKVLKWRQISDWWEADVFDATTKKLATTPQVSASIRLNTATNSGRGRVQSDTKGLASAKRLSLHPDLAHAQQAATARVAGGQTSGETTS